jgi:hypothetical protein
MHKIMLSGVFTLQLVALASAQTAVPLSTYADARGYLDVQKLTCDQLANTYQEDADALTAGTAGGITG